MIIIISVFSTVGGILFIFISYFLCKRCLAWWERRKKLNAVKPRKATEVVDTERNLAGGKERKQSMRDVENGKRFMTDSQREDLEEPPSPKRVKPSLKMIREGGFHEDVLATLPSTAGDAEDPYKRDNSRAPRRQKENPLNKMFGP